MTEQTLFWLSGTGIILIAAFLLGRIGAKVFQAWWQQLAWQNVQTEKHFIEDWARQAVQAAEQLGRAGLLPKPKKEFALEWLQAMLARYGINVSRELLEGVIEAAVLGLFPSP